MKGGTSALLYLQSCSFLSCGGGPEAIPRTVFSCSNVSVWERLSQGLCWVGYLDFQEKTFP
jgi:hypothetical protein